MRDRLTKERRSWNMSRIRGKNTSPEIAVRRLLHRMGYRFRLHVRIPIAAGKDSNRSQQRSQRIEKRHVSKNPSIHSSPRQRIRYVCPDIVLPKYRTVIFVHGCFWHRHRGCKNCTTPTNRRKFWVGKLEGNAARDKLHQAALRRLGWRILVIWECEIDDPTGVIRKIDPTSPR
ncbi:MAG TPA: very short patch repair endonuclease [Verrucomicrobiae bacterium]|nr:very short patch repair endonuclease [Verrucomicrobiae bacterium]